MVNIIGYTDHLTAPDNLEPVLRTHLGQAHFAGTGPDNKTCRQCDHWHSVDGEGRRTPPRYRGRGKGTLYLQPVHCRFPIANKADRRVPHDAEACRLFEENADAPAASRRDKRFKVKA